MNLPDDEAAKFVTDGWLKRVADVPIDEVPAMVCEDPSIVTALIGALRHERKCRRDEQMSADDKRRELDAENQELTDEANRLRTLAAAVNEIRNDIVARQSIGFSRHVYPLVAALQAAGIEGEGYEVGRPRLEREVDMALRFKRLLDSALDIADALVLELAGSGATPRKLAALDGLAAIRKEVEGV